MKKRIVISLSLLALLAALGINFAKQKSDYRYTYNLPVISDEKRHNDFRGQVEFYVKKISKNPGAHADMSLLAQLYAERAKELDSSEYYFLAARYAYKSINAMPLYNPAAYFVLADIALAQNDFTRAINLAHVILKQRKSKSPEAYIILSKSHFALGNLVDAMAYADELIAIFPSEKAFSLRAGILAEQGRNKEALTDYEEAISLREDDPVQASETRAMFANFLINRSTQASHLENAKKLLDEALRINPTSAIALGFMGKYYETEEKYSKAIFYYKEAFRQSKQFSYLIKEARVHKLANEAEIADLIFAQTEVLIRQDLKKSKMTNARDLIRLMLERGNPLDYPETLYLASKSGIGRATTEALLLHAWALELNGQLKLARKMIRQILARNFHSEEVLERASSIEAKLKNKNLSDIYKSMNLTSRAL